MNTKDLMAGLEERKQEISYFIQTKLKKSQSTRSKLHCNNSSRNYYTLYSDKCPHLSCCTPPAFFRCLL